MLFDFCFWREFLRRAPWGLTSFITERSKQERCCRQLDERHPAVSFFLFGHPKRKRKLFLKFLAVFFSSIPPQALLLSSLKEVSKKGATVSTRWTPTRGTYPLDSSPRNPVGHLSKPGRPALPCGPGVRATLPAVTWAEKRKTFQSNERLPVMGYVSRCGRTVSPGLQGKAGSRR